MSGKSRQTRLVGALAASLLAGGLLAAGQTSAAAAPPHGTESVTLALTPHDPAGLTALANAHGISRSQRIRALSEVVPSAQARGKVAAVSRQLGLTVTSTSTWAVRVSGPAALVRRLFGSARGNNPHSRFAHNLPTMPAAFRGLVTAAFGGDETRPAFEHAGHGTHVTDAWTGPDLRAQYGAATATTSGTQTIATVQLSDWHSSDLASYAAGEGLPAPAAGQYTGVKDPYEPPVLSSNGDDIEVDLDQEAIYGIYPAARQRAYLSANNLSGMYDDLLRIGDDASNAATDGYHITAASISWGSCEDPSAAAAPAWDALENVLQYVLAAGVTVFASSGDNGAFCDATTSTGVAYPASSPEVVAVGGTEPTAGAANPPTTERAWSGSGGGTSALFFRPSWQTTGSGGHRTVPDISSLAGYPGTEIYTSSPSKATAGWYRVGGTSLSSPTSAALLTYELAKHGYQWGIGDIHPALYGNPGDFTDITSGTQANGGVTAGPGYDTVTGLGTPQWDNLVGHLGGNPHLSVPAYYTRSLTPAVVVRAAAFAGQSFTGYRLAIDSPASCGSYGLSATPPTYANFASFGAPAHFWDGDNSLILVAVDASNVCHFANSSVFIDTRNPTARAGIGLTSPTSGARVTAKWSWSDPAPSSGLGRFAVTITNQNGSTVYSASTSQTSATISSAQGYTYTVKVTAYDRAGNASSAAIASYSVPADDSRFSYSSGWSRQSSSSDYGGANAVSARTGSTAAYTATARKYVLWVITGPYAGKAAIYAGSTYIRTIDLYASATHYRVPVTVYSASTLASRKITVKVTGTKNGSSRGYNVYVDALQPVR